MATLLLAVRMLAVVTCGGAAGASRHAAVASYGTQLLHELKNAETRETIITVPCGSYVKLGAAWGGLKVSPTGGAGHEKILPLPH